MASRTSISAAQARRIALAAQGFGVSRGAGTPGTRQLGALIRRLGLLQIDSVNVFERSHYLPAFSRLGGYDRALLDRLTFTPRSPYIEYWAHEAAILPVASWPLLRWRMEAHRERSAAEGSWAAANAPLLEWLLAELADRGPLPASAIEHDANKRKGPWWGWSDVKTGLEVLFRWGAVVTAGRIRFERVYARAEHILDAETLQARVPRHEAHRRLLAHAARAHGIGTASDLADYFRLKGPDVMPALAELEREGELIPVTVEGWNRKAWLHRDARVPRSVRASALLSPFDPVVWERARTERLFGFRYRIEIYTPKPKRVYGYYTLPLLLDDRLVGRVDLKSDRRARVLRVKAAWQEASAPAGTAARLAPIVRSAAAWQGLDGIEVEGRGDLAAGLAAELGQRLREPAD